MNIKHLSIGFLLTLCVLSVKGQNVCLETDFYDGIPDDFTLICYDEMPVKSADFKKINSNMLWTVSLVDSEDGVAAVSTSHRTFDLPTDNWMITPRLTLPASGACLKWTSRAVHYHLRDGYKVMVSTTGNEYEDFEELYAVEEEEYLWTKHYVSLEKYAGKDVYIAFVHNSQNKFLLAVDDMFVGQPSKADFIVENETPRFVGDVGTVKVQGTVLNSGMQQGGHHFTCVINGTEVLEHPAWHDSWHQGVEYPFEFDVPVQVGKATHYKVMNGEHTIVEDSVICSYFPRTLFLEKATGAWCVNCPEVISFIQRLEEEYGHQIVCVEAHAHYGDKFEYMPYVTGMKTNSFPTIHINRNRSNSINGGSPAQNLAKLRKIINQPTVAKIEMDVNYEGGDSVQTVAKVTFANDTDNSSGKFRVGYVLIEKELQTDSMRQINGVVSIGQGEFYYMTSPVPADLMWYTNVVRGENNAFVGVKNSLPATIEAGVEYTVESKVEIPVSVYDRNNLAIVAIVMNYYTDEVLNVVEVKVPEDLTGVQPVLREDNVGDVKLILNANGHLRIVSPSQTSFVVEVIAADGRQVATMVGEGSADFNLSQMMQRGLYLLRISQNGRVWTKKLAF